MKVCVDPGHGMANASANVFDSGATSGQFREADITLSYGLKLNEVLRARNFVVFMTRTNNTDPTPVDKRAPRAKAAGCEMFVSFHLNADDNPQAHGLEVLYGDDGSKDFAQAMQTALIAATNFRDRNIQHRPNLAVLKFDGPAVLMELGFITNAAERSKLLEPQTQTTICNAVADVLRDEA